PHRGHAGAEALLREPGGEQLGVAGGRAEVPEDGIGPAREEREAGVLVARPLADVRARDVADVGRVEEQDCAEIRSLERRPGTFEPLPAQPRKVDALLPVHCPCRVGRPDRPAAHAHCVTSCESGAVAAAWDRETLARNGKSAMKASSASPASPAARLIPPSPVATGSSTPASPAASRIRSMSFPMSAVVKVAE